MASRRIFEMVVTTVVVVVVVSSGATAQSDCNNVIVSLAPCLDYVTGNSSTPSSGCCNQLANVIKTQVQCLCEVINSGAPSMGVSINQTRALALPGACNLQSPSISLCNATSPSEAPNGSSGSPKTPSGGDASDGCRIKISFADNHLFSVLLILASFASIFTAIV